MPEAIYDREQLRKQVLEQLRKQTQHQTTSEVARAIGVQWWAAEVALEELYISREATFAEGAGWLAVELAKTGARALSDDAQTPLGV